MIFCRLIDSIVRNKNVGIFLLMSLVLLFVECGRDDVEYPTDYRYVEILTVLKNDKGMILEKVGVNDEETIKKKVQVEGKHKKQSGGSGQYGHVKITFAPGEDIGLTFTQSQIN